MEDPDLVGRPEEEIQRFHAPQHPLPETLEAGCVGHQEHPPPEAREKVCDYLERQRPEEDFEGAREVLENVKGALEDEDEFPYNRESP